MRWRRHGDPLHERTYSVPVAHVVKRYEEGASLREIGDEMFYAYTGIRKILLANGVKMRSVGQPR